MKFAISLSSSLDFAWLLSCHSEVQESFKLQRCYLSTTIAHIISPCCASDFHQVTVGICWLDDGLFQILQTAD